MKKNVFTICLLFVTFLGYTQDKVIIKFNNFTDSIPIGERLNSSNYFYYEKNIGPYKSIKIKEFGVTKMLTYSWSSTKENPKFDTIIQYDSLFNFSYLEEKIIDSIYFKLFIPNQSNNLTYFNYTLYTKGKR